MPSPYRPPNAVLEEKPVPGPSQVELLNYSLCLPAPSLLTGGEGLCIGVRMTGSLESPTLHRWDFPKVIQNPLLVNLPHAVIQDHRQLDSWRGGESRGRERQEESQVRF